MNKVTLTGNLATEPEYAQTQNGISRTTFRLAVRRRYVNADGTHDADFISVVCWRGAADVVHKFVHKGDKLGVIGVIQTRSYQAQDGTKRYATEIVADEIEMLGRKAEAAADQQPPEDFAPAEDDEIPF